MVKSGNSSPTRCVYNLLRTWRGEVPYERLKGLDPKHIGKPSATEIAALMADIQWNIETYEPRVDVARINLREVAANVTGNGDFDVITRLIAI